MECADDCEQTAARNAQIYRLESADVVTGYVTEEQLTDMPIYRYLKNRTELEMAARQRLWTMHRIA